MSIPWYWPWFFTAAIWVWIIYQAISLRRLVKQSRRRTAVYGAAMAAYKRGDWEEFDFLYKEWERLAKESERLLGIKHEPNSFRGPPL